MVRKMNLDGRARKALVAAIEELTGEKAVYRRMPTCNYDIGEITVLKDGSIDFNYPSRMQLSFCKLR